MQSSAFVAEPIIRMTFFGGILLVVAIWEWLRPRRPLTRKRLERWPANLMIVGLNQLILRLLLPFTAIGVAVVASEKNWGLLNLVEGPFWLKVSVSVLFLDLVIYWQHVLFHRVPILWRLHRMHHADLDIDVTTGSRFHPIEIIISMILKVTVVWLIGVPPLAVLIFEVLLNATAMFNHGNIFISPKIDRFLRLVLVTPDMHRVHHSVLVEETDSNFGFNWPWWDRIFKTYREQPKKGHDGMTIGLSIFRDPKNLKLLALLKIPFVKSQIKNNQ